MTVVRDSYIYLSGTPFIQIDLQAPCMTFRSITLWCEGGVYVMSCNQSLQALLLLAVMMEMTLFVPSTTTKAELYKRSPEMQAAC